MKENHILLLFITYIEHDVAADIIAKRRQTKHRRSASLRLFSVAIRRKKNHFFLSETKNARKLKLKLECECVSSHPRQHICNFDGVNTLYTHAVILSRSLYSFQFFFSFNSIAHKSCLTSLRLLKDFSSLRFLTRKIVVVNFFSFRKFFKFALWWTLKYEFLFFAINKIASVYFAIRSILCTEEF